MSKHTPGPWHVNEDLGAICQTQTEDDEDYDFDGPIVLDDENCVGHSEVAYNLKLMAASPELLAACKEALQIRKQTHHGDDKLLNLLQDVIKKATE